MNYFLLFVILLVISETPLSSSNPELYEICSNEFRCGDVVAGFPFWGGDRGSPECGHPELQLRCEKNNTAILDITGVPYRVLEFNQPDKKLKIAREHYEDGICPQNIQNTTLAGTPFVSAPGYVNLKVHYCCPTASTPIPDLIANFSCKINGIDSNGTLLVSDPGVDPEPIMGCSAFATVVVREHFPTEEFFYTVEEIEQALKEGFEIEWNVDNEGHCQKCMESKGKCGVNSQNISETVCYCQESNSPLQECAPQPPAGKYLPQPPADKKTATPLQTGLFIAGAVIAGILLGAGCLLWRQRRKRIAAQSQSKDLPATPSSKGLGPTTPSTKHSESIASYSSSKSDLEKGSTYFGVQVFTYSELEEATHNFDPSKELGDGGFGTVYYGVLSDGRVVAVKRLYENNVKRVEQFINEIKILADIRHPNLVTLYGCTSRHSRELLLVYEYIPNGTLADHLHGRRARSGLLTWPVRLTIAIETANALAYLHGKEIIHRDVKTNNILLDNNCHVKVADFGLSRLFPNDVTHVSTAPQGTPGYVDPEYYQCYHLTDKSDVYSFGVVLIELISAKQAVDTNRHRLDINLANMAISRIQNQALHELVDPSLAFETDFAVRTMITTVAELAFRCLQQERDMRPSMEEVLEVLKGMQNEELEAQFAEVVDIRADDVGLLRHVPPPLSPDSTERSETDKWVQIRTM